MRRVQREYKKRNAAQAAERVSRDRAKRRQATPAWANVEAMRLFYLRAARLTKTTGIRHHVDHIVPLVSKVVCGLHWEGNMRVIPALENQRKTNRRWPGMWEPPFDALSRPPRP